jgi:hypothetical protein
MQWSASSGNFLTNIKTLNGYKHYNVFYTPHEEF